MNNLTVKTKEAQFSVACENAECNDLFRRIVKELSAKLMGTECGKSAIKHCESGTEYGKSAIARCESGTEAERAEAIEEPQRKYRGTLFVRCPHCGREFFYYQNEPTSECTRCNCGNSFWLEDMKLIRAYCKCGNRICAITNESSDIVTINCHTCGAPLDLEYNKKESRYENMR